MKKIKKFNEPAWVLGVILIALGVCLVTKAGFGVSMVVAPAYIIHLVVSQFLPWYSFGTSEYILQGVLLAVMCIVIRRFDWRYLLSFLTAVIYGYVLDLWFVIFGGKAQFTLMPQRIVSLIFGVLITAFSIALFFRTYMPQQVYELFVSQVSNRFGFDTNKTKLIYDMSSLGVAVIMAVVVSHFNRSVKFTDCIGIGTIVCTAFNAPLITLFGKLLDKIFVFDAAVPKLEQILKYK